MRISIRRPTHHAVHAYCSARAVSTPTCSPSPHAPPGFRHQHHSCRLEANDSAFERARLGMKQWQAHRGAGVEIFPVDAEVAIDTTVALLTRQLGIWILAACRITSVTDEADRFGFTYATLPGHPECGYESFTIQRSDGEIRFEVEATSKPGNTLVSIASVITNRLQARITRRYLDALFKWAQPAAGGRE